MTKSALLLYVGAIYAYCRYLPGWTGNDVPVYLAALAGALFALREHRLLSKGFLFHFLFIQGITVWLCHFFLAPHYQLITGKLVYVRSMLLGLFLVLEVIAAWHIVHRYRIARRRSGSFACDAFARAISPYPMLPELQRLFHVEFNIWRALLLRTGLARDRDGAGMTRVARIEPGYRPALAAAGFAALLALALAGIWLLPFPWYGVPLLAAVYFALLLNCEITQFGRHAVYADGGGLHIPNGIHGFVSIDRSNIERISFDAPGRGCDLTVARLLPPNLSIRLVAPVEIFGARVQTLGLCVRDVSEEALARWTPAMTSHPGAEA